MTTVEQLVATALAEHGVARIPDGYRVEYGQGQTQLTFKDATTGGRDGDLVRIADIETRFTPAGFPAFNDVQIARLNRRAAFGGFFRDEYGLGLRMTFSLYERDPAARWAAMLLLAGLGHQLPFAVAAGQSELSDELFRGNRANLEYPRQWATPVPAGEFVRSAETFCSRGFVASYDEDGITLEVPLADGAPTRIVNPAAETALVVLRTNVPHPLAGVGYFASLSLPLAPVPRWAACWASTLNAAEHEEQDFVPRNGAWAVRGHDPQLVYNVFVPDIHGDATLATNIANWMVQRALWIRSRWWTPGRGLGTPVEFAR